jgi:putative hemolysin
MPALFLFILLTFFLLLSALFSLSETAVLSSNRHRLRHLAATGNSRAKRLADWLDAPQKLLASLLLGNNFANIGAATVAASAIANSVAESQRDLFLVLGTVLLTVVVLLFCELGPKSFATRSPEKIALSLVVPIEIWMKVSYPVSRLTISLAGFFFRSVREDRESLAATISDVELKSIINSYTQDRRIMLQRVLDFSERQVRDIMVPRIRTVSLAISTPIEEVLEIVETTRLTRFPVYQGSLDNVLGILHGKDLMPYLHSGKSFRLSQLLRKPIFLPDTAPLNSAVHVLQSAQTHLGIVVDEHGGVEGIVTLEDLVEQIVGEIQDEHDIEIDEIIPQPNGSYLVDAGIAIHELNERLNLSIPENAYYVTLAGFIMMKTGKLPEEGETVEFENRSYELEQVVGRRIMRVRVTVTTSVDEDTPDHREAKTPQDAD